MVSENCFIHGMSDLVVYYVHLSGLLEAVAIQPRVAQQLSSTESHGFITLQPEVS